MAISRRAFLRTAAATTVAGNVAGAAVPGKRRNLLWIMTDQQPRSCVGAYGRKVVGGKTRTPNLDRIAAEGVRFSQFHLAAFPCSPSRACFLTGRYSHNHGVLKNDVPLDANVPALGDVLKAAGYRTGHIGKWHLSGSMYRDIPGAKPFEGRWYYRRVDDPDKYVYEKAEGGTGEDAPQHGFDVWAGGWAQYREYLHENGLGEMVEGRVGNHNDAPSGPDSTHAYSKLPEEHHMAAFFAKEAVKFLEAQRDEDDPFGLVVSFYGPHLPVAPPKPWDDMYPLEDVPLPRNHRDNLEDKPLGQRRNRRCYKLGEWSDDQFRDYIRRYWGYCSYIDHQIGRVLEALDASGQADNTVVLFTSDHGDMVGAHGFVYKLCSCGYDELLRVPFLLRCPGRLEAGALCNELVSAVDVLPTVLELLDVPAPGSIDGRSFLPALAGEPHRRVVVCNSMGINLTVVAGLWKYVLNWNPRDLDELYDRKVDMFEMRNRAVGRNPLAIANMRDHIRDWLEETGHPYAHTIIAAMEREPEFQALDLWPEITEFEDLGNGELEFRYVWHAVDALPGDDKYWSFTHFANPKYGKDSDIVFRDTTWPEPATTAWQAGKDYPVGPVRVRIPDHAGPGKYTVRIGLYNPEKRTQPGQLVRGQGNAVVVGELVIRHEDGSVPKATFKPAR